VSSIDIILMGMLTEQPRNAYEVNKVIEARRTRTWLRISTAAVYRNLRRLHDEGYIEAETTRDGLKPHKTVFTLTPAGREHFVAMLEESASDQVGLHFDFDAWVAHIDHLPPVRALEFLDDLRCQLGTIRDELATVSVHHGDGLPVGAAALVELRLRMLEVALSWLGDFALDADSGRLGWNGHGGDHLRVRAASGARP